MYKIKTHAGNYLYENLTRERAFHQACHLVSDEPPRHTRVYVIGPLGEQYQIARLAVFDAPSYETRAIDRCLDTQYTIEYTNINEEGGFTHEFGSNTYEYRTRIP